MTIDHFGVGGIEKNGSSRRVSARRHIPRRFAAIVDCPAIQSAHLRVAEIESRGPHSAGGVIHARIDFGIQDWTKVLCSILGSSMNVYPDKRVITDKERVGSRFFLCVQILPPDATVERLTVKAQILDVLTEPATQAGKASCVIVRFISVGKTSEQT